MADRERGLCKDCKWWQIEPKAAVKNLTMGLCIVNGSGGVSVWPDDSAAMRTPASFRSSS